MKTQELYEAIFHRKAVRKYDPTPLTPEELAEVETFAADAKPLIEGISYKTMILGAEQMGMVSVKAPHYLCFYAEKKEGNLLNAGFILQQVDLQLSEKGYGSCWVAMGKPAGNPPAVKGMEYIIMLAFGKPAEPVHRKDVTEFKRLGLSEISKVSGADGLLEPVRLAPSASNTQTWLFTGSSREITLYRRKLSLIKGALYGKYNNVDMGIALCHLWLAIKAQGKQAAFDFSAQPAQPGTEFIVKVSVQ